MFMKGIKNKLNNIALDDNENSPITKSLIYENYHPIYTINNLLERIINTARYVQYICMYICI